MARRHVAGDGDQGVVQLDAAGGESKQIRHDGNDAGGRTPLQEPEARGPQAHQHLLDRTVLGGHKRMKSGLRAVPAESIGQGPSLLSQGLEASLQRHIERWEHRSNTRVHYQRLPGRRGGRGFRPHPREANRPDREPGGGRAMLAGTSPMDLY